MNKISIVTVSFNSNNTIEETILSVINQTYKNIEYIIIDGLSTDGTLDTINKYKSYCKSISEPDNGIYDAMNKGINSTNGEVVAILNSDDLFIDEFALEKVMNIFKSQQVDCVFADLYYVAKDNTENIIRHWKTNEYKTGAFNKGWHPAHPAFFLKKEIYNKYGLFDLSFKLAADFELMLRMLEKHHISSYYLPKPLIKMRLGGATNKTFLNIYSQNIECVNAFKKNGLPVSYFYPFYRLIPKLKQYFKNK